MPDGYDPLDDLREAWRSVEPPPPADELADADPTTRAVVGWLREAWQGLEPRNPLRPPVPAPVLAFRPATLARLAVAALVVALAAALFWRPEGARVPEMEVVPERLVPRERVQFASLTSEHIEMRSGPVRLILLTGDGHPADGGAGDDHEDDNDNDLMEEER